MALQAIGGQREEKLIAVKFQKFPFSTSEERRTRTMQKPQLHFEKVHLQQSFLFSEYRFTLNRVSSDGGPRWFLRGDKNTGTKWSPEDDACPMERAESIRPGGESPN
jgi:hypothetical protein